VLRLASWKASSAELNGPLLHPLENGPCSVDTALDAMVLHAHHLGGVLNLRGIDGQSKA
jgi:hypothetical protein